MIIELPDWARIGILVEVKDVSGMRGDDPEEWYKEKIIAFGYDGVFHQAHNCPIYYTEFSKYGETIRTVGTQEPFGKMRHLTQEECKEQEEYYLKISKPVEGINFYDLIKEGKGNMRIILDPYLTKDGVICNIFSKDKFTSIKADNMKELGYKILERVRILSKHEYKQIVKISIEASGVAVALANYLTSYGIKVKILKSENIDYWLPIN